MRAKFMPISRHALMDAAISTLDIAPETAAVLRDIERKLELIMSLEAHDIRIRLNNAYAEYDPDTAQPRTQALTTDRDEFLSQLYQMLESANFQEYDWHPESTSLSFSALTKPIKVDLNGIDQISVFVRGARYVEQNRRRLFLHSRNQIELSFDHVLFVVSTSPDKPHSLLGANTIHLKLFRDVTSHQIQTVLPCAQITMPPLDKLLIGVPAIAGGVPLLANSLSAIAILFGSISALLGFESIVDGDPTKAAIASLSGLFAVGAYISRQFMKYERRKLRHEKQRADIALFNLLATNAGTLDYTVTASVESELKEVLLLYIFLISGKSREASALDREIEAWLSQNVQRQVDFDILDAEQKLISYGLGTRDDNGLHAFEPNIVSAFLDRRWTEVTSDVYCMSRPFSKLA